MRSKAVKRGEVTQDSYGNIHGLKEKARQVHDHKKEDDEFARMFGNLGM